MEFSTLNGYKVKDKKAIRFYNTVDDMINDITLKDGMHAKTKGYYSVNDGGFSEYHITATESNSDYQEELSNGLYATLIIKDYVTPEQFGAKGDGETDDSDAINRTLSSKASNIKFTQNKIYMVRGYEEGQAEGDTSGLIATTGLVVPSNTIVDLNESTIKCITNSRQNYNIFTIAGVHDVTLKNGTIIGDRTTHTGATGQWGYGVAIKYSSNIILDNLKISECWGDGINLNNNGDFSTISQNITIRNCICDSNRRQGMSIENGENIYVTDSSFNNTGNNSLLNNPASGVDIEPGDTGNTVKNVIFDKCCFNNNYNDGIIIDGGIIKNVKVINSKILNNSQTTSQSGVAILECNEILFENNIISNEDIDKAVKMQIRAKSKVKFINNDITNAQISLYSQYMSNDYIIFENNHFKNNRDMQYNAVIETVDVTTTNTNNTLIVRNNTFTGTPSLNITGWVYSKLSSKFNKLIAENNIFKYGKRGISTNSSNIIKNNNFVALWEFPILLNTGNVNQVSTLDSNIFEECSYNANNAGIIYNSNNNNIILQNNIIYKNCLSTDDQQTRTYSPYRFLQNLDPTGVTVDENNNVLDNTIS